MDDLNLQALTIEPGAVRTAATDPVIQQLDIYFRAAGKKGVITSILRTPAAQLLLIQNAARDKGIIANNFVLDFERTGTLPSSNMGEYPVWQIVWSQLLNKGYIINPPVPAKVLLDYFNDGVNKKGETIQPSAHFTGKCFDTSGENISSIFEIIDNAKAAVGIVYVRYERENNCVHSQVG